MKSAEVLEDALARCIFAEILKQEFHVEIHADEQEALMEAAKCMWVFDDWQEFYKQTNWEQDNPAEGSREYLLGNRICRIIEGRVWYFSRLEWEKTGQ